MCNVYMISCCRYFVLINAVAAGYTLIMLFFPSKSSCGHFVLLLDLVIVILLVSSVSACLAIGMVGKNGNSHAGWLPICNQVPKFCDRVTGAMVAGFVALLAYFLILLYSIHNVMNLFTLSNTWVYFLFCFLLWYIPTCVWKNMHVGFIFVGFLCFRKICVDAILL